MKNFNVGIIGYGWAASAHIAAINATTAGQVSAICSARKVASEELSARYGRPMRSYTALEEMLEDPEINVVSVCGLPDRHADQAVRAARAGKHLIIEKPVCLTPKDLTRVLQAVDKAAVKACVCFECRFSSQFLATKALLDQGLLGKLHYGEIDYYHGIGPWYGQFRWNTKKAQGGSALLSAGCHALDALLFCMGNEVIEVMSAGTKSVGKAFAPYEYPSTSVTILKFKNGAIGKCTACIDCLQPYYFHTHLVGSKGSLLDNRFHSSELKTSKENWSTLAFKPLDSGDVSDHPYQTQFEAFFNALEAGRDMPLTSLREAARTHDLIFAADRSAALGRPVKISQRR
ncbi:MAG TPA: Gfo/Idh/MocA family oxidoreductase [Verrucomicrobiae bacterium]|nr:Gfo/Idh/MocA family oxidoreductase [Verrucomicrobiae bacterium]